MVKTAERDSAVRNDAMNPKSPFSNRARPQTRDTIDHGTREPAHPSSGDDGPVFEVQGHAVGYRRLTRPDAANKEFRQWPVVVGQVAP